MATNHNPITWVLKQTSPLISTLTVTSVAMNNRSGLTCGHITLQICNAEYSIIWFQAHRLHSLFAAEFSEITLIQRTSPDSVETVTEQEAMVWFPLPLSRTSVSTDFGSKFNGTQPEIMALDKSQEDMKKFLGTIKRKNSNRCSMVMVISSNMTTPTPVCQPAIMKSRRSYNLI